MNNGKKIVANRLNARRSSGPKTAIGKNNSRRNAVKHGFFSNELSLLRYRKNRVFGLAPGFLQSQLQPMTALVQRIALEEIGVLHVAV